jgi:hypothetical protein
MKSFFKIIIISVFLLGIFNLNAQENDSLTNKTINPEELKIDSIIAFGKTLLGKPYRYRVEPGWQLDCSGYISYIFSKFGYTLPHSSSAISGVVNEIDISQVRKGDLLFFKGRNIRSSAVGHISMVISLNDSGLQMMHSARRGIIIDQYPEISYYRARFIKAGRPEYSTAIIKDSFPEFYNILPSVSEANIDSSLFKKKDTVSIIGVGDMMLGTHYPNSGYLPPNDGRDILLPVIDILKNADVTFGNHEGVILSGKGTVKRCSKPEYCYAFKSPDHYIKYFVEAGFDVMSLANNHVRDFGAIGVNNTVRIFKENNIHFAGLVDYPFDTFTRNGLSFGFCAFAPNTGTIKIHDTENAQSIVKHLDSICDIVIVSFHGGAEGSKYRHITRETEIFLGENRGNPYQFSRAVIDAGADIVFGHGPHVTRAIDLYKDRFIAYSLGNFATYGRFNLRGVNGLAPIIKVNTDSSGKFLNAQIYSTKQVGEGGPQIDEENKVLHEIINLTKTDIPECELEIDESGLVRKREE